MRRMIIEDLKEIYPTAYEFLLTHDMVELEDKRYELGNKAYVNVESYDSFEFKERRYEAHLKYIDIHYIIIGKENIIVEPVENLSLIEEYDLEKDIIFYDNNIRGVDNILEVGDILLLETTDGHMPCIAIEDSVYVKKAVFKFPIR